MNALTLKAGGEPITMTSLELVDFINEDRKARAEAVGAPFPSRGFAKLEHSDFMKKAPDVLGEAARNFFGTAPYTNGTGGTVSRTIYRFPKREACLMAMSYSYDLQAKVFDRMTAAEQRAFNPATLTRLDILKLAMESEEARQAAEAEKAKAEAALALAAPKVEALDRIARSDGSLCITDAAKTLQVQPRTLSQLLEQKGWIYRRPGTSGFLAYQDRIQSGHLEHKVKTGEKSTGGEWTSTQVRVTPRGLTKLAEVIRQAGLH